MDSTRQIPPQNIEAEMSILGGIFLDNGTVDQVSTMISSEDFYRNTHRHIFDAMCELADKNEPIDLVTLSAILKKKGELEEVGGGAYLDNLIDYVPTAANIAYYCRIVADKSAARKMLAHTQAASGLIYDDKPIEEIMNEIEQALNINTSKKIAEPADVKDVLRDTIHIIETRSETSGKLQGMPYGIDHLDNVTDGAHRGELIVVAGRPSMGKTSFGLNVMESICSSGLHALLFTLEMSRQNIMDKILSSRANIKYHNIRKGLLERNGWEKLAQGAGKICDWHLHIDDTPGITFREIRSKTRRLKKKGLDLMIVDYLQLMSLPTKESRTQALGEVSRGLKQLARELDISVIAVSQLNRAVDSRPEKKPMMSDLRDSGEIEQDADVILFPFREAAYCQKCKDRESDHDYGTHQSKAEIIIEKQRNGERNISVQVTWLGEYQKFVSKSENSSDNPHHWTDHYNPY